MAAGERIIRFTERAGAEIRLPVKIQILKRVIRPDPQNGRFGDHIRNDCSHSDGKNKRESVFSCFLKSISTTPRMTMGITNASSPNEVKNFAKTVRNEHWISAKT